MMLKKCKKKIISRDYTKNELQKIGIVSFGNFGNYLFIKLRSEEDVNNLKKYLFRKKFILKHHSLSLGLNIY